MISQPRIAVLGMSKLYVFIDTDDSLLVVVVLGFRLYLRFKLRFKPSTELYLRTSTKTRIAILVFFNHYSSSISSLIIRLPRGLVSIYTNQGSQVPLRLVLVSRSVLVLSQPSDISDLVPPRLVSIIPAKSHVPTTSPIA